MIQVALVGFGLSGRYLQAPFFVQSPHFQLKTVVTNRQEPAVVFPGVQKASSLAEVLADPTINLVSIATPNETHFDYARQCLEAGRHVLVEKPFTNTVEEANTLIALAQKQQRHIFVFQNRRFDSDFLTVQHVFKNHLLGDLVRFEAHFNRFKPILNPKKWKETPGPANGILYDLGSHLIDQAIALFGAPRSSWVKTSTQRSDSDIDDAFDVHLDYGLLQVHLSSSLLVREDLPRYILHGRKGSFVKYGIDVQEDHLKAGWMPDHPDFGVEPTSQRGILHTELDGLAFRGHLDTHRGAWMRLFDNMANVILHGDEPAVPVSDVVEQIRIMN
jgi:scyllo-inositol 2-dehydrogenase (NADP+)